ncbi:MAG: endonuclease V [Thermoplasmata archaeon]
MRGRYEGALAGQDPAMRFRQELEALLAQVVPGRVTTFGALAGALGDVRASVPVFRLLRRERPPGWHRVVRTDGSLAFPDATPSLAAEGVEIRGEAVCHFRRVLFQDFRTNRPLEALRREQRSLASQIVLEDRFEKPRTVAGFDVSYRGPDAYAAAVLLDWETLEVREEIGLTTAVDFPYISTYLAHREFEPVACCYARFTNTPSLLLVDGNGTLHPGRFGVACYVGLKLDRPTIGVAKSLLTGRPDREALAPGEATPVRLEGEALGYAFRPGKGKPTYVSPGHRISGPTAMRFVRRLCRTRIPEPLRLADRAARRLRRAHEG